VTFNLACEAFARRKTDDFATAANTVVSSARQGLSKDQIVTLCLAIAASGDVVQLPLDLRPFVDVPSTGGPASLTTLLSPLLIASSGLRVPKLSATGSIAGGIDTMAIIPGYQAALSGKAFIESLRRCGFAHATPSANFCPADNSLIMARRTGKMMANAELATASLLAKKLATPGTAAVFDFRVGRAGNIGEAIEAAQAAKELFLAVASELNLKVDVVLTENRDFPSSALGRLESLHLLWQVLRGDPLLDLDKVHLDLCIELAGRAIMLVNNTVTANDAKSGINDRLNEGGVKRTFIRHIEAQGANIAGFEATMLWRDNEVVTTVCSPRSGYWVPPDVNQAKNWLKREQMRIDKQSESQAGRPWQHVGLKLLRSPGDVVEAGDPVLELRYPREHGLSKTPDWLSGETQNEHVKPKTQVLSPASLT
jgi:thymidine phosphorylase